MKKLVQISIALVMVMVIVASCSVVNKTAGVDRSRFVGTWTVTSINYDGIVGSAVQKIFDQASPNSFDGSTWQLTNSGNGAYTLPNGTAQSIFWSYYNPGGGIQSAFQFKKVYQGDKIKDIDSGYRLTIGSVDASTMTLKVPITMGNQTGYVVLGFMKK